MCIVFASPPWGGEPLTLVMNGTQTDQSLAGPGYRSDSVFDLSKMQPYNLMDLLDPLQHLTTNVVLYLPRTSDLRQLTKTVDNDQKITVVYYCMEGASKVGLNFRN